MSNNPPGDRPRKKGPRRASSSDQQPRQNRQGGERQRGERQGGAPRGERQGGGDRQRPQRSGRLSREEIEWARDLWTHREPVDEIAQQLGVPESDIEALIAGWEGRQ